MRVAKINVDSDDALTNLVTWCFKRWGVCATSDEFAIKVNPMFSNVGRWGYRAQSITDNHIVVFIFMEDDGMMVDFKLVWK